MRPSIPAIGFAFTSGIALTLAVIQCRAASPPAPAAPGTANTPPLVAPAVPADAAVASLPAGLTRDAFDKACASTAHCQYSRLAVWRSATGAIGAIVLDNMGCGPHPPNVFHDASGNVTYTAEMFPYYKDAPADDPFKQRAEAQQAKMASLLSGLTEAEKIRCVAQPASPAPAPAPSPTPGPAPMSDRSTTQRVQDAATDATLTCSLVATPSGGREFHYRVHETSGQLAYVLDVDTDHGSPPVVNTGPIYLAIDRDAKAARIVQGLAPLPPDYRLERASRPFAAKLAASGSIERVVPLPARLREMGPYNPVDFSVKTRALEVEHLIVDVHLVRPLSKDVHAVELRDLPGAFHVSGFRDTDMRRVTCTLDVKLLVEYASKPFVRLVGP